MTLRGFSIGILALSLGLAGTTAARLLSRESGTASTYRTVAVTQGTLAITIDASGTLEPEAVVDVGAQVAGQILSFGTDAAGKTIDYGSPVEQGAVLARIDEALAEADVKQADAQLASALAGVRLADATLAQRNTHLAQARREWERAQRLDDAEALAQTAYDAYRFTYDSAQADVAVAEASRQQAAALLTQAETTLWRARRNLGYCTIVSPVTGVVIDRRVNIGQTVVASLSAPSLFLIAKDLKRMRVWVAVNEADITLIYPGQPVTFTVDALPDETFRGTVDKIRLNASMTQNIVTYVVEVATDNADGRLLPYLTANVRFEVKRREGVLLVPNAALRWTPAVEQVAPEFREELPAAAAAPLTPAEGVGDASAPHTSEAKVGFIYTPAGRFVRPLAVRIGINNGTHTEVEAPGLAAELAVVTGMQTAAPASAETKNPFTPKLPAPPKGMRPPP